MGKKLEEQKTTATVPEPVEVDIDKTADDDLNAVMAQMENEDAKKEKEEEEEAATAKKDADKDESSKDNKDKDKTKDNKDDKDSKDKDSKKDKDKGKDKDKDKEKDDKKAEEVVEPHAKPTAKNAKDLIKAETTVGTKTVQPLKEYYSPMKGRDDLMAVKGEEPKHDLGGKISIADTETNRASKDPDNPMDSGEWKMMHYEGSLGSFDYDPKQFAIVAKPLAGADGKAMKDKDGNEATMPVLKFVGDYKNGDVIDIPDGVKSLDYTFADTKIESVPVIPESVESAHCAFMDCKKLKQASKEAKTGELNAEFQKNVGAAGIGAGVAGLGTVGAFTLAGSAVPVVGNIGGAVIGTVVAVSGAIVAKSGAEKDGIGGKWAMPSKLKDGSYMFSGCDKLEEGFEIGSDKLVNARGMYEDTPNMGANAKAVEAGATQVTDFKESSATDLGVEDAYTGSNSEIINDDMADNKSKYVDSKTGEFHRDNMTESENAEVNKLQDVYRDEDIRVGQPETDISTLTGGMARNASHTLENGAVERTKDINALNMDKDSEVAGQLDGPAGLIDRGIVSLGEFAILKMVTGKPLIAAAGTFGLQAIGVLPKSMQPIIKTVANFVGEDNPVGKKLNELATKLDASTAKVVKRDAADDAERDQSDKTIASIDSRVSASMDTGLDAATAGTEDITTSMRNNGALVAADGIFLSAANKDLHGKDFKGIYEANELAAAALEEKAASYGDKMSKEQKEEMASTYLTVMEGLEAYSDGAVGKISDRYGDDATQRTLANSGLNKVMTASTAPLYDSMKEMNDKYDFLSKEDIEKIDSLNIVGLENTKFKDYQKGTLYDNGIAAPEADGTAKETDGTTKDGEVTTAEPAKTTDDKTANAETVSKDSKGEVVESRMANEPDKSATEKKSLTDKIASTAEYVSNLGVEVDNSGIGL